MSALDLEALVDGFWHSLRATHTAKTYVPRVRKWIDYCDQVGVDPLHGTVDIFDDWLAFQYPDCKPATRNVTIAALRSFFMFAVAAGVNCDDPTAAHRYHTRDLEIVTTRSKDLGGLMRRAASIARRSPHFVNALAEFIEDSERHSPKRPRVPRVQSVATLEAKQRLRHIRVCSYCGQSGDVDFGPDDALWHVDHVVPLALGGCDELANIVKSCRSCNMAKGVRLLRPNPGCQYADGHIESDASFSVE